MTDPPLSVPVWMMVFPSLKSTMPVGVPVAGDTGETVTVKVTDSPKTDGFCDEVTLTEGLVLGPAGPDKFCNTVIWLPVEALAEVFAPTMPLPLTETISGPPGMVSSEDMIDAGAEPSRLAEKKAQTASAAADDDDVAAVLA